MTVAEINALLYSPSHPRDRLERALRIDALSPGWRSSFEALLQNRRPDEQVTRGSMPAAGRASGGSRDFGRSAVAAVDRECDGRRLADAAETPRCSRCRQPCRANTWSCAFELVRRVSPFFRSYSLSGPPSTERYRISVKIEPNGAAGACLRSRPRRRPLDVSLPRGSFILQREARPSCCSARESVRRRFWRCCMRSRRHIRRGRSCGSIQLGRQHHPFAAEVRRLLARAPEWPQLCLLQPAGPATIGSATISTRRVISPSRSSTRSASPRGRRVSVRSESLHDGHERGALDARRCARTDLCRNLQRQRIDDARRRRCEDDASSASAASTMPTPARSSRLPAAASRHTGTRRRTEACWSSRKRATCRFVGRAGPVCATTAKAAWCRDRSPTSRNRWTSRRPATCSSAARDRFATW